MKKLSFLICTLLVTVSCGKNSFRTYEQADPMEDAAIAMEKNNPQKAMDILGPALAKDPNNYRMLGLMAAAVAQRWGIDTISIALKMATQNTTSSATTATGQSTNQLTGLFSVLPPASDENISGVKLAIEYMNRIPATERTIADNFIMSMLQTALTVIQTKKFDKDGDGLISPLELLNLDDDSALDILESIIAAEGALTGVVTGSSGSDSAGDNISTIRSEIDKQEGTTSSEKLRNFLDDEKNSR